MFNDTFYTSSSNWVCLVISEAPPKRCETPEEPIEENLNRIMFEGAVASNIDEAISVLNGSKYDLTIFTINVFILIQHEIP